MNITAQQFQWNFQYPGDDGKFGPTSMANVSGTNFIGLDTNHADSKDDVTGYGEIHFIVNKPVIIHLRSKDVIHSFFLPAQRVKQDAVPGMGVTISFTPDKVGEYEIACAELCGALHYNMKGKLVVDASEEDFKKWQRTLTAQ